MYHNFLNHSFADGHLGCFQYLAIVNCAAMTHTSQSGQHKQIHKQMLERMRRKGNPSALLVGMKTGEATVENSMEFPQKTKNGTAF